jgi:nucleoside 2-deoxyribosyltransferase
MKIYLAAKYSRREEMQRYANQLAARGHQVTSRWIHGDHEGDGYMARAARFAQEDLDDLAEADCLIQFVESARAETRGGNHVEFGYALATGKLLVVVGVRGNVFHCLPQVNHFFQWHHCLEAFTPSKAQEVAA